MPPRPVRTNYGRRLPQTSRKEKAAIAGVTTAGVLFFLLCTVLAVAPTLFIGWVIVKVMIHYHIIHSFLFIH